MTPSQMDVEFSRHLMVLAHRDVKAACPHVNLTKDAWVWNGGRDNWEFHGPGNFYWYGSAGNAYEARAKGWNRWLVNYTKPRPELE